MNDHLRSILTEVFGLRESEVHLQLNKEEVGNWDSLKQMDLVTTLEREYSVMLEITDIVRMVSVAGIVEVLLEKGVDLGD